MADSIPMFCKCRNCGKKYQPHKSRADLTGYCSQKCLLAKAKEHGWGKKVAPTRLGRQRTYYDVLSTADQLGYVEWIEPAIVPFGLPQGETAKQTTKQKVWVFTAECSDHGRQVIAVTDYNPNPSDDGHLWELLERYLKPMVEEVVAIPDHRDSGDFESAMREHLNQYVASDFQVDELPVLTQG